MMQFRVNISSGAIALFLVGAVAAQSCVRQAWAGEVCRYRGSSDYAGHVAATTDVIATGGITRVKVAVAFDARAMLWFHIRYLIEEVSAYRSGELQSVAVNNRYIVNGHIVRQQWDEFRRSPDGLRAYRLQGKTLTEFGRKYPGFLPHWDLAAFGRPWLRDYWLASPDRRADLDLKAAPLPFRLRPALAMAFYWVRWLPASGQDVHVFLPGMKTERLVDVPMTPVPAAGGTLWQAPLRRSGLSERRQSMATAFVSPDRHLLQLAFDLHKPHESARGLIRQEACEGVPVPPTGGEQ